MANTFVSNSTSTPKMFWSKRVKCKKIEDGKQKNNNHPPKEKLFVHIPDCTYLWNPIMEKQFGLNGQTAPYYFCKLRGDFQISVKLMGHFHHPMDQAGILIQVRKDHYISCGIEVQSKATTTSGEDCKDKYNFQNCITTTVVKQQHASSSSPPIVDKSTTIPMDQLQKLTSIPKPKQPSTSSSSSSSSRSHWFCVKRRGKICAVYVSTDGNCYIPIRIVQMFDNNNNNMTNEKISVGCYGASPVGKRGSGFKVVFEDLRIKDATQLFTDTATDNATVVTPEDTCTIPEARSCSTEGIVVPPPLEQQQKHSKPQQMVGVWYDDYNTTTNQNNHSGFHDDDDHHSSDFDSDGYEYPVIGPGHSDDISVVSDVTMPTVVAGYGGSVPDEERNYFQQSLPTMIISTGSSEKKKKKNKKKTKDSMNTIVEDHS